MNFIEKMGLVTYIGGINALGYNLIMKSSTGVIVTSIIIFVIGLLLFGLNYEKANN